MRDGGLETQFDLWLYPLDQGQPTMYVASPFKEFEAIVSPDSNWLAYVSDEDGAFAVYVDSFPEPGDKRRVGAGEYPVWRRDGQELYYLSPEGQLMVVQTRLGASSMEVSPPEVLFDAPKVVQDARRPYAVLDNGERFILNAVYEGAEPRSITVVKNWKALLED